MYRFFLGKPFADTLEVTGQDAHHMGHVLRMKVGDEVQIVSLDQIAAVMKITAFFKDAVTLETVRILEENHEPTVRVTLYQGLPKQDKMEWIIQKPLNWVFRRSNLSVWLIVSFALMRGKLPKAGALAKIAEAAAKQSKRDIVPVIKAPLPVALALTSCEADLKLMAYEVEEEGSLRRTLQKTPDAKSIALLIGPEGGISGDEFDLAAAHDWQSVSLGPRILRTETAALAALAAIQYETGNLGG